ncbi:MAG: hypothetical protein KC800_28400, partial [Candidatus Eremiobacteraeota bacterium]|nr:hypothetical protein [Candidatus Eremiobacteraeota bacterium]
LPVYPFQRRRYWGAQPYFRRPRSSINRPASKNVRQEVERAISNALGAGVSLSHEADLWQAGLDSLRVTSALADLWRALGVRLTPADVVAGPTIDEIVTLIEARKPLDGTRLVTLREGAGVPLVCIHPAGGDITAYLQLRRSALEGRPLYAIQTSEVPVSVEAAASRYVRLMREVIADGPVSLLGWSLGGVIAREMAFVMESDGSVVESVHLVDPPSPETLLDADRIALAGIIGDHNPQPHMDLEVFRETDPAALLSLCEEKGWLPRGLLDEESFSAQLRLYKGHVALLEGYRPRPVRAGVRVSWASQSVASPVWREFSGGRYSEETVDGNHYSILGKVSFF